MSFGQVGSSATLGTGSVLKGTVIAFTSITTTTNAAVDGRLIAINGAVTLDTNHITVVGTDNGGNHGGNGNGNGNGGTGTGEHDKGDNGKGEHDKGDNGKGEHDEGHHDKDHHDKDAQSDRN